MTESTYPTLESAIEWLCDLQSAVGAFELPMNPHVGGRAYANKPLAELSGKLLCAKVKHDREMTPEDWEKYRQGADCVEVRVAVEWGGHTHHRQEPIRGARVRLGMTDRRRSRRDVTLACGHYDSGDRARPTTGLFGTTYLEDLGSLLAAAVAWIEEGGPIRPPSAEQSARAANEDPPSSDPDQVTEENARTYLPDGRRVVRLGGTGSVACDSDGDGLSFAALARHHGATVIYDLPAPPATAGFVGTFTGGELREVLYEAGGRRRYAYCLLSADVDSWGEEVWVTSRRLTAEAAGDTIEAARKLRRASHARA